jgi:hypothetical protein
VAVEPLAIAVVFVGIPLVLASIYRSHLSHTRVMKILQLRAEANARLMDRFGQDPALLDFLKSDVQQQMFDVKLSEPTPRLPTAYMRMLTALQISFMLLCGGAGCLWFSRQLIVNTRDQPGFVFIGTLGIALGVGSLLSAAAAYVVARLWKREEGAHEVSS